MLTPRLRATLLRISQGLEEQRLKRSTSAGSQSQTPHTSAVPALTNAAGIESDASPNHVFGAAEIMMVPTNLYAIKVRFKFNLMPLLSKILILFISFLLFLLVLYSWYRDSTYVGVHNLIIASYPPCVEDAWGGLFEHIAPLSLLVLSCNEGAIYFDDMHLFSFDCSLSPEIVCSLASLGLKVYVVHCRWFVQTCTVSVVEKMWDFGVKGISLMFRSSVVYIRGVRVIATWPDSHLVHFIPFPVLWCSV